MSGEIKMSVSSMTRTDTKKAVYVMFQDGKKSAEFTMPGGEMVKNAGFDESEIRQLQEYLNQESDTIFALAKEVNPIKAFLGK